MAQSIEIIRLVSRERTFGRPYWPGTSDKGHGDNKEMYENLRDNDNRDQDRKE